MNLTNSMDLSPDAAEATAAAPVTEPAPTATAAPDQPSIPPTSEYDNVPTYTPTFKLGTSVVLGKVVDFGPAQNQEEGTYNGWLLSFVLAEEVDDDAGGKLPIGQRCGPYTIFTQVSTFRNEDACKREAKSNIQGLNQIIRNKAEDPKFERADAAFAALPWNQKLPNRMDTDQSHYDQWRDTICKFVVTNKNGRVNLNAILAAATPDGAIRR